MPELIVYLTQVDVDLIRTWVNADPDVVWLRKVSQNGRTYFWRACPTLDFLGEGTHAIWHPGTGRLNIPSGQLGIPDEVVEDPFRGWKQTLEDADVTAPWFGGNLPGPFTFTFRERGRETPDSLARSGFHWLGDRYKAIGKPAHPDARRWWSRLRTFVKRSTEQVPWIERADARYVPAFIFPEAARQLRHGRHRDVNPWVSPANSGS